MPYIGVSPQFGVRRKHTYTATAGQTSFSGAGSEGATLSYKDSNFVDVYQNGVKLGDADYTSTSGTAIVLAQGASVDDLLEIIVFDAFSAADTVSKADGGQFDGNITMAGTLGVTGTTALTGNATMAGTLGVTGAVTADAGVSIDNITIDGTEIDLSSGDLTIDVASNIKLDADGGDVRLLDGGTQFGVLQNNSSDFVIQSSVSAKDLIFKGNDSGGSAVTALTLDMSDSGAATFNSSVTMSTSMVGETTDGQFEFISKDTSGSGGTDYGDFIFKGRRGADNDTVTIMNMDGATGKIGIGHNSPDFNIDIRNSGAVAVAVGSTNAGGASIFLDGDSNGDFTGSDYSYIQHDNAGRLNIYQDSPSGTNEIRFFTGGTESMRIKSDGTVSVGVTTDADAKLYASRGDAGDTAMFESTSSASSGVIAIRTSIGQNNNNTNSQHLFAITQNVASFKLHGNGSSTFSSDERLKKNIETTRDGYLEDLAKLRVVKYNWHCDDDSTDKELGLIAQEVQKIFPKLVVEDDVELNEIKKPLALKVSVLPMMLLKALQEANTKITALEARITALEGE